MGVLGVFFGCRGDGGFNGRCLGASIGDGGFTLVCSSGRRGVIGFNVATSQQPVREKVRPARLGVWVSAKKFALLGLIVGVSAKKLALRTKNGPQSAFYDVLGEVFRGTVAERTVLGELFRGTVAERSVLGEFFRAYRHGSHVSHVMWRPTCRKWWGFCTTRSPLAACRRRVGASCSAIPPSGGRGGVRTCRGPGGWTLRLAVLTRRCAAKPYWWHGGQPAQATTSRVNVRIKGRSCPPAEPVSLLGANPRRACPQQSAENCAQKPARPRRRTMIGSKYRPFRAPRIRIVAERPRPR